jgi:hypothetical protein
MPGSRFGQTQEKFEISPHCGEIVEKLWITAGPLSSAASTLKKGGG